MLENFCESLQKLSDNEIEQWFNDAAQVQWNWSTLGPLIPLYNELMIYCLVSLQRKTGSSLVKKVSTFVTRTLNHTSITENDIKEFTSDLQSDLREAAKFSLAEYFDKLVLEIQNP